MMHALGRLAATAARTATQILADVPDPGTGTTPPGDIGPDVEQVLGWLAWGVSAVCVGGVLINAARMAMSHRRGDDVDVASLGKVMLGCALLAAAGPIVSLLVGDSEEE